MSGRSVSLLALILVLFAPSRAHARTQNFLSGTPFGIGFVGGLENRPVSGFAAGNQTTASNYSTFLGFEPFLDLLNVCFRLHVGWHFYPLLSGAGSDTSGSFTESVCGTSAPRAPLTVTMS